MLHSTFTPFTIIMWRSTPSLRSTRIRRLKKFPFHIRCITSKKSRTSTTCIRWSLKFHSNISTQSTKTLTSIQSMRRKRMSIITMMTSLSINTTTMCSQHPWAEGDHQRSSKSLARHKFTASAWPKMSIYIDLKKDWNTFHVVEIKPFSFRVGKITFFLFLSWTRDFSLLSADEKFMMRVQALLNGAFWVGKRFTRQIIEPPMSSCTSCYLKISLGVTKWSWGGKRCCSSRVRWAYKPAREKKNISMLFGKM